MSLKEKNVSFQQTPSVSSANWVASGNFTPNYQVGWVCPKCGAVMAPTTSVCINCNGHVIPSWTTTTPNIVPCRIGDTTEPVRGQGTTISDLETNGPAEYSLLGVSTSVSSADVPTVNYSKVSGGNNL